jgi:hypothetical protein
MARDAEYFFMYFLALCTSSIECCLFNSFAQSLIKLLVLLEVHFLRSLYILGFDPLSDVYLAMTFSHCVGSLHSNDFSLLIQRS